MSDPLHLFNNKLIDAQSMGTSITSSSQNMQRVISYAVQVYWTGTTPIGTFDLQASNDDTNYTSLLSAPIAVTGNTGSIMIDVAKRGYGYIKVIYTRTSGTGTITVQVNATQG